MHFFFLVSVRPLGAFPAQITDHHMTAAECHCLSLAHYDFFFPLNLTAKEPSAEWKIQYRARTRQRGARGGQQQKHKAT